MSTIETTGYCETCKTDVLLVREEINIPLVIILAIFTGGFFVLIYFIIYQKKVPNRCVHCKSDCQTHSQLDIEGEGVKFCPICGVELDSRTDIRFCALCGGRID